MSENPTCPVCFGDAYELGSLGFRLHLKCRDCGCEFSHEVPREEEPLTPSQEKTLAAISLLATSLAYPKRMNVGSIKALKKRGYIEDVVTEHGPFFRLTKKGENYIPKNER